MPESKILVIGLDDAGKTTLTARILRQLGKQTPDTVMPTIGVEAHVVKYEMTKYKIFDLGGAGHFRSLWELYAGDATHLIIVIDASDKSRLFVIRDEIQQLVTKIKKNGQRVLLVANKSDIQGAIPHDKIVVACSFESILRDFSVKGCSCSALHEQGLEDVFSFITGGIANKK